MPLPSRQAYVGTSKKLTFKVHAMQKYFTQINPASAQPAHQTVVQMIFVKRIHTPEPRNMVTRSATYNALHNIKVSRPLPPSRTLRTNATACTEQHLMQANLPHPRAPTKIYVIDFMCFFSSRDGQYPPALRSACTSLSL